MAAIRLHWLTVVNISCSFQNEKTTLRAITIMHMLVHLTLSALRNSLKCPKMDVIFVYVVYIYVALLRPF